MSGIVMTKPWLFWLLLLLAHSMLVIRAEEVCFVGYIMDNFCIKRGTLLDKPSLQTLEKPNEHSVHCLVDVARCRDSGFEVLRDPVGDSAIHCRAFKLDSAGIDAAISLARKTGKAGGCTTCTGTEVTKGFRATVKGTVDSSDPPRLLKTTAVLPASVGCGNLDTVIADDDCNFGGADRNFVIVHGSMMITGWGVLLPSGVIVAHFLRYLDPLWFKLHRAIQILGLAFALGGFIIAVTQFSVFQAGYYAPAQAHGVLGVIVMCIGLLQPVNALLRPHKSKGEGVSPNRRRWEYLHKGAGYFAVVCAIPIIFLGTFLAGGKESLYFQIAYVVLLFLLLALIVTLFIVNQGKCKRIVPKNGATDAVTLGAVETER